MLGKVVDVHEVSGKRGLQKVIELRTLINPLEIVGPFIEVYISLSDSLVIASSDFWDNRGNNVIDIPLCILNHFKLFEKL